MLEGVQISNETVLEITMQKYTVLQRENIMLEAALNEAHRELEQLRTLVPTDEEVKEDGSNIGS